MPRKSQRDAELKKLLESGQREPGVAEAIELYEATEEVYIAAHAASTRTSASTSTNATAPYPVYPL